VGPPGRCLFFQRALAIRERTLGQKHEMVAVSLRFVAWACEYQEKFGEAERFYRRALQVGEQALGPRDPFVAQILEDYADMLRKTKRVSAAEKLEARAKDIRARQK
jgi:kinesin light chain